MSNNSMEQIRSAIGYIEAHLAEKLDLGTVADAVHYSKYHLHRMFRHTVGMTLYDYIQRRRLTEAAKWLVFSDRPILDIALAAGYESQQAFTNVFTAMYKQPPNRYRENEKFYPLQLKFDFERSCGMHQNMELCARDITAATQADIPCWMELVRLVIDGFPHLYEEEYVEVLKDRIDKREAFILKDGRTAIGVLIFSCRTGSIEFMGTHPLYRNAGIPKAFIAKIREELTKKREISITTYRAGDKADTGHRRAVMELGFAEAELLVEFGYPTQRFILQGDAHRC
ncbi:helix-turn-helix domain-containing protein [Candidatus Soleaferrea massiliensis]|uniref:helix-turn-helix domain-containing protein n=1 Tax=Candidatus Soleaferrea massiliensis TaxID=1470354 RepID=UPI00058DC63A|nr:AraC family transcriptional regulator [Candidatus Soleaferrea massiliensis]